MLKVCEVVLYQEAPNKLKAVPLSNNSVARRIEDPSADIQSELLDRLRTCNQIAIHLDESTDIAKTSLIALGCIHRERKFWRTFSSVKKYMGEQQAREYSDC